MSQVVGNLSDRVISALNLDLEPNQPIYLGESDIAHKKSRHPEDYVRYGTYLRQILEKPDYVGQNPKDGSIEYVKEFQIHGEFGKVSVRLSGSGSLYARSLYVLNQKRVYNFIQRGTLKKV